MTPPLTAGLVIWDGFTLTTQLIKFLATADTVIIRMLQMNGHANSHLAVTLHATTTIYLLADKNGHARTIATTSG